MQKFLITFLLLFMTCSIIMAQEEVLFTIDGIGVSIEEFERVYNKNNNIPGVENTPVEEYLERYINFRLKVLEAMKLGYDTIQSFVDELAGYREQLARPFLQDKMVIERLVREAYDRTIHEVNVSHILMLMPDNPVPEDTARVYRKIMDVRERLLGGEVFEDVAVEMSEDPSVASNLGNLGWIFAFVMDYPLEDAAYNTEVDGISMPVRASYGYHLIRVTAKREALGEVKLAHIMTRAAEDSGEEAMKQAEEKIQQYYEMASQGRNFGDVARMHSEDAGTSGDNGQMRWLRSGELPPDIEEAVFALRDSGNYTRPMRSIYGWHIFQLLDKRSIGTFDELKAQLEEKIAADERILIAEEAVISKMKKQSGFIQYTSNIEYLDEVLDSSVYAGQWNPVVAGDLIEPVFIIDGKEYLQKDLVQAVISAGQYNRNIPLQDIIRMKSDELIHDKLIEFRKSRLEDEYPEFNSLLQEYHDGILLFNISDDLVWQSAVEDTAGFQDFYEENRHDYTWGVRADVSKYQVYDISLIDEVRKYAKRRAARQWTSQEVMQLVCNNDSVPCITIEDMKLEKGEDQLIDQMRWKKGEVKVVQQDKGNLVIVVNNTLPPAPKDLSEIRGMIIADYQDYLEQQWVSELRKKYPVVVNDNALNKIQIGSY